jgi:hypothetical protein
VDWRRLRQQGFLTLSIVLASGVILTTLFPFMDLRAALITIAVMALLLGWVP